MPGDYHLSFATELTPHDSSNDPVARFLRDHWGSMQIVSRGKLTDVSKVSRVIATDAGGHIMGLATFVIDHTAGTCELVSLDATVRRQGIGRALVAKVEEAAKNAGCHELWLITTNGNPEAAVFYVHVGFRLTSVHLDALDQSRKLKPEIPKTSEDGLPIQDEWEFRKVLTGT